MLWYRSHRAGEHDHVDPAACQGMPRGAQYCSRSGLLGSTGLKAQVPRGYHSQRTPIIRRFNSGVRSNMAPPPIVPQ
jgi:hypothetical protein